MADTTYEALAMPKRRLLLLDGLKRLIREKPLGALGGIVVLALLFTGIFAGYLAPHGENEIDLSARLSRPSPQHLLGTDNLGRDILSRIVYGARISVVIGLGATSIAIFLSTTIGILTGYFGGRPDILAQRLVDAWMSFPPLIVLIVVMSLTGTGIWQIIMVLGLVFGISNSRVIRSATIALKGNLYVEAARAIGAVHWRIVFRHILPNILAPIIILFTTNIGSVILAKASMSFLGYGVPPGTASWGSMLSWEGRQFMELAPQLALWPGLALSLVVFSMNMFGDAVRDLLDPRLRGGLGRYGRVKKRGKREAANAKQS